MYPLGHMTSEMSSRLTRRDVPAWLAAAVAISLRIVRVQWSSQKPEAAKQWSSNAGGGETDARETDTQAREGWTRANPARIHGRAQNRHARTRNHVPRGTVRH